ncbi:MAG: VOC family protein [Proteobacteria bacterium]|nr:VOC family protein [Pseudomonadota bacterium]
MKIRHIAIKVDDIEAAGDFYENTLGFRDVRKGRNRDHFSRHMTDGNIDIALVKYDSEDSSNEVKAAGAGPCIHHIGFEVDDLEARIEEIKEKGYEIISDPGVVPVKFRAPGGTITEFAPRAHFKLD